MDEQLLTKAQAMEMTGKSESTISRWMKSNAGDLVDGRIPANKLEADYPFIQTPADDGKRIDGEIRLGEEVNRKLSLDMGRSALNAVQRSLDSFDRQMKAKDEQIKILLKKRVIWPVFTVLGLLAIFGFILWGLYVSFEKYETRVSNEQTKELAEQADGFKREIANLQQIHELEIENLSEKIESLKMDREKTNQQTESQPLISETLSNSST